MNTPPVSVLMTAFNRESYIAAAIESVLSQTFADFELVIVDDCSTDATVEVASRYLADPRVRLERNSTNLGDYPNRNHAATFARGELLKYHDSDDVMYPHCLEVMVAALESAPEAACALTFGRGWLGGPCPMVLTPKQAFEREYLGQGLFHVGPAGALLRRDVFEAVGGFPIVGPHSDNVFWLQLCAEKPVVLCACDLFWYRVHAGQWAFSPGAAIARIDVDRLTWEALAASNCPLDAAQREQARRNRAARSGKALIQDVAAGNWRAAVYRFRHSGPSVMDWLRYTRRPRRDVTAGSPRDAAGEFVMPSFERAPRNPISRSSR